HWQQPGNKKGRIAAAPSILQGRARPVAGRRDQRWRALKRGLDLQITKTLPRRRTTLQSRWRAFADLREDRTFMMEPRKRLGCDWRNEAAHYSGMAAAASSVRARLTGRGAQGVRVQDNRPPSPRYRPCPIPIPPFWPSTAPPAPARARSAAWWRSAWGGTTSTREPCTGR